MYACMCAYNQILYTCICILYTCIFIMCMYFVYEHVQVHDKATGTVLYHDFNLSESNSSRSSNKTSGRGGGGGSSDLGFRYWLRDDHDTSR
jgi:uncharacterized membrane protein YgcG